MVSSYPMLIFNGTRHGRHFEKKGVVFWDKSVFDKP